MDIYKQVPLMDVLSNYRYAVKKWGKATDALSALKNHTFFKVQCWDMLLC
jgi:hypothetical protein